jgi:phosphohistidine phosphatase
MHLYLIRHAEARPVGASIPADADRPLSSRGEEEALTIGRLLARTDPELALVLTSPLQRAIQTGSIIAGARVPPAEQRVTEHLVPGFRARALVEELLSIGSSLHVALVGHQPDMTALLSRLITGGSGGAIAFPPGSVACLTASPMGQHLEAQLRWMITPQLAAAIPAERESRRVS